MPEAQKQYYQTGQGNDHRGDRHSSDDIEMEMAGAGSAEIGDPPAISDSLVEMAVNYSWYVNWLLLCIKIYCYIISSSKAVAAAMADSVVDILSQMVLYMADLYINKHSKDYPVGRSRLEALSVLGCAGLMIVASIEVVQAACLDLIQGLTGDIPVLENGFMVFFIMGLGIGAKLILYLFCSFANAGSNGRTNSDQLGALAEDHLNDVMSNAAAIATLAIAIYTPAWWSDPIGAILISVVIIYRWLDVMNEQVKKVVGHTAPESFIRSIYQLGQQHDSRLVVDCIRAYHFGARYNVEMEIVLPGDMTVKVSHDIALELQHKIEKLIDVERAFVHVDHELRDGLEHKIERELWQNAVEKHGDDVDEEMSPQTVGLVRRLNNGNFTGDYHDSNSSSGSHSHSNNNNKNNNSIASSSGSSNVSGSASSPAPQFVGLGCPNLL